MPLVAVELGCGSMLAEALEDMLAVAESVGEVSVIDGADEAERNPQAPSETSIPDTATAIATEAIRVRVFRRCNLTVAGYATSGSVPTCCSRRYITSVSQ
jgi:hypothetical protein